MLTSRVSRRCHFSHIVSKVGLLPNYVIKSFLPLQRAKNPFQCLPRHYSSSLPNHKHYYTHYTHTNVSLKVLFIYDTQLFKYTLNNIEIAYFKGMSQDSPYFLTKHII